MDNEFLPKGYTAPKNTGNYYKLEKGTNRFRILSPAIVGHQYWTTENKPVRSRKPFNAIPVDARIDDGKVKPKHFWAFLVWNYEESKVQVMEITQTTIMSAIEALVSDASWGSPKGYDIAITATGDGLDREYSVLPKPHSEAPKADISNIRLDALFDGGDPFNATTNDGSMTANVEVVPDDFPAGAEEPSIS
jgi:hypothetical protein